MPETSKQCPGLFVIDLDGTKIGMTTLDRREAEHPGGRMPPIDRYVGYVPVAENSLQGTILAAFYRDQRIIRAFSIGGYGDAFYVLA